MDINTSLSTQEFLSQIGADNIDLEQLSSQEVDALKASYLNLDQDSLTISDQTAFAFLKSILAGADHPELVAPTLDKSMQDILISQSGDPKMEQLTQLSLEMLMELLQDKNKSANIKSSLAQLELNAATKKEQNAKQIEEINKQIDELKKQENMSGWQKFLAGIKALISVFSAIAAIAVACVCPNPLTVVAAICSTICAIESIMSACSEGKLSISGLMNEICKNNEKLALALSITFSLLLAVGSSLSIFAAGATSAVKVVNKAVQAALEFLNSSSTLAQGALNIVQAKSDKAVSESEANRKLIESLLKELQAIDDNNLDKIKEELNAIDFEQNSIEAILKDLASALKASAMGGGSLMA